MSSDTSGKLAVSDGDTVHALYWDSTNSQYRTATLTVDGNSPPTPGGVGAVAKAGGDIAVSFDSVTDSASGVDHYVIYRSTSQGSGYSSIDTVSEDGSSSYTYTDLSGDGSTTNDGTTYYYKVSAVDGVSNEGSQSSSASATADASPPTYQSGTPSVPATSITSSSFDINVESNEDGMAYYVVVSDGANGPSATQVVNGKNQGGSDAIASGSTSITSGTLATLSASGLSANTKYDVYTVIQDDAGNNQLSGVVNAQTSSVQSADIVANPSGSGQSANHSATTTLGSDVSFQKLQLDFTANGDNGVDLSDVGTSDITALGVDTTGDRAVDTNYLDSGSNAGGLNSVNIDNGKVITVTTSSSTTLAAGDTLVLNYTDAVNPSGDTDVTIDVNPQSSGDSAVRTLSIGSTPTYDGTLENETITDSETGVPQKVHVQFSADMNTDATPDVQVTGLQGGPYDVTGLHWADGNDKNLYGNVTIPDNDEEVTDAKVAVSGAEDADGNIIPSDAVADSISGSDSANTFDVDTVAKVTETLPDTVSGSVSLKTDIDTADVSDTGDFDSDGTDGSVVYEYSTDGSTYTSLPDNLDTTKLSDGTLHIGVVATEPVKDDDSNTPENNVNTYNYTVTVDNSAPKVVDSSLVRTHDRVANLSVTTNESLNTLSVDLGLLSDTITLSGVGSGDVQTNAFVETDNDDGTYTYNATVDLSSNTLGIGASAPTSDDVGNGAYTYSVNSVTDTQSNQNSSISASGALDLQVDDTAPQFDTKGTQSLNESAYAAGDVVLVKSEITNPSDVDSIKADASAFGAGNVSLSDDDNALG